MMSLRRHDARRTCLSLPLSFARILLLVLLLLAASRIRSQSTDTIGVSSSSLATEDSDSFTSGSYNPSDSSSDFGSGLPDVSPFNTTYGANECQLLTKWSGPRCPEAYQCVSPLLQSQSSSHISYAQQQCVFCAATDYCSVEQLAACNAMQINATLVTLVEVLNSTEGVGVCEACQEGQYCPANTTTGVYSNNPFGLAIVNLCSSGYYCPDGATQTICPIGFYCLDGTKFPYVCPYTGTYCGEGSTSPSGLCPGGSYCPDPQTLITCPSGYFCKEGSIAPRKCQLLASCPAGSAAALLVWQGIILVFVIFIAIGTVYYSIITMQTRRQNLELEEIARRTEGREVVELLKSLQTFKNIENRHTAPTPHIAQPLDSAKSVQDDLTILRSTKADPMQPKQEPAVLKVHHDDIVVEKNDQLSPNSRQSVKAGHEQAAGAIIGAGPTPLDDSSSVEQVPGRGTIFFPVSIIEECAAVAAAATTAASTAHVTSGFDTGRGGVTMAEVEAAATGVDLTSGSAADDDSEGDPDDALQGFDPIPCPISITFDELGLKLRNGKQVLSGVTGEFAHSTLTAIMGPSGAGKSTFLNVLCGKSHYGIRTGGIRLNDVPASIEAVRSLVGFVPQEDVMHTDLTCYENLYYSAMLRLPRAMPHAQKVRIVEDVIRILGLEAVQHSIVGTVEKRGISGGQRKKVNIGLELVAWPTLLFLDEPTSGLDSTASFDVISALRDLTGLGVSICTVLHQPRFTVMELFHEMLLLGRGGRSVFHGSSEQAVAYFTDIGFSVPSHENPADFFLDVISGDVRREYDPDFQPNDLFTFWDEMGGWVRAGDGQPPTNQGDGHNGDAPQEGSSFTKTPSLAMMTSPPNDSTAVKRVALPALNVHTPSAYYLSGVDNLQPPPPLQSSISHAVPSHTPQSEIGGSATLPVTPPLLRSNTVAMGMFARRRPVGEETPGPSRQNPYLYPSTIAAAAVLASATPRHPSAAAAHHRSRNHFQAINALRAGVTSAAEMPLPKHREMLAKFGIKGIGQLVEEYNLHKQRPLLPVPSTRNARPAAAQTPSRPAPPPGSRLRSSSSAPSLVASPSTMRAIGFLFERPQSRAANFTPAGGVVTAPTTPATINTGGTSLVRRHSSAHQRSRSAVVGAAASRVGSHAASHQPSYSKEEHTATPMHDEYDGQLHQQTPSERVSSSTADQCARVPPLPSPGHMAYQTSSQLGGIDEVDEEPTSARPDGEAEAPPAAHDAPAPRAQSAPHRPRLSPASSRVRFQGCGELDDDDDDDADGAGLDIDAVKLHLSPMPPAVELTRIDAASASHSSDHANDLCDLGPTQVPPFRPALTSIPSEGELPSDGSSSGSRSTTDNKGPTAEPNDHAAAATPAARQIPPVHSVSHSRKASHDLDAAVLALRKRRPTISTESPSSSSRSLVAGSRFAKESKIMMPRSQSGVLPPPREVPYLHVQFAYLLQRQSLKLMRGMSEVVFDMCLTAAVGFAIGLIFGGVWALDDYSTISVLAVMSIGVLSCVSALKMFGNDRVVFWRESSAGISVTAYWLAVTLMHLPLTVGFSFLFVAPYWSIILPDADLASTWWVFLAVHFACSGGGMLFSVIMRPIPALLCGVMIPLCIGGFLNGVSPALAGMGTFMRGLCDVSYGRYGVEALVIQELNHQPDYAASSVASVYESLGFTPDYFSFCVGMLFTIGCVLRALTLAALHLLNRDKRV